MPFREDPDSQAAAAIAAAMYVGAAQLAWTLVHRLTMRQTRRRGTDPQKRNRDASSARRPNPARPTLHIPIISNVKRMGVTTAIWDPVNSPRLLSGQTAIFPPPIWPRRWRNEIQPCVAFHQTTGTNRRRPVPRARYGPGRLNQDRWFLESARYRRI